jgi:Rrf2 family protein
MKLITRDTDYALRSLIYIAAKKNKITSVTELVRKIKIPRPFLRKLLQRLNKEGILKSSKGQNGGFILAQEPKKIYLAQLIEIFQGGLKLNECLFKKRPCPESGICPLNKIIENIEKDVVSKLSSITVASLLLQFKRAGMDEEKI